MSDTARGGFANHFGPRAPLYRAARPTYPPALFHFLAIIAPSTRQAWDCATGNGQAATALAERFAGVLATDASAEMIADAEAHPRVRYAVAQYETGLPDHCAGIVTVAQALHWLDEDAFMREARRVLVPDGLLAAWCYGRPRIALAIDKIVDHFHDVIVGPYWPPERRHVEDQYRAIALPIDEYAVPPFEMAENWTLAQFGSYVRSWSSVARCLEARGEAPVVEFEAALAESWGEPKTRRRVRWPMHFRVGEIR